MTVVFNIDKNNTLYIHPVSCDTVIIKRHRFFYKMEINKNIKGFTLFFDMKESAMYLTKEELGEVILLGLNGFPDGEEPSTIGGKMFYAQMKANLERDNKFRDGRGESSKFNGNLSIGRPRNGETKEEYQERQSKHSNVFDKVLRYCLDNGVIEDVKNRNTPKGFMDNLVELLGEENKMEIIKSMNWIAKNMK